jgi:hypothetical protein
MSVVRKIHSSDHAQSLPLHYLRTTRRVNPYYIEELQRDLFDVKVQHITYHLHLLGISVRPFDHILAKHYDETVQAIVTRTEETIKQLLIFQELDLPTEFEIMLIFPTDLMPIVEPLLVDTLKLFRHVQRNFNDGGYSPEFSIAEYFSLQSSGHVHSKTISFIFMFYRKWCKKIGQKFR